MKSAEFHHAQQLLAFEHIGSSKMAIVAPILVAKMQDIWASSTGSTMDVFGISENTWAKLRQGSPIRESVAKRLIERLIQREAIIFSGQALDSCVRKPSTHMSA